MGILDSILATIIQDSISLTLFLMSPSQILGEEVECQDLIQENPAVMKGEIGLTVIV